MSESCHIPLPRSTTTRGVADLERLMRATQQSTVHDTLSATNLQTAVPDRQEFDKEDILSKLTDLVVSKGRPDFGDHVAGKKKSVIVITANIRDVIAAIPASSRMR